MICDLDQSSINQKTEKQSCAFKKTYLDGMDSKKLNKT